MEEKFKEQKNKIYPEVHVDNFREFLEHTTNKFSDKVAFSYKKDVTSKNPEYVHVTYKKHYEDVKAFSTKLLSMGLEGKRVAIISHNQYQWPVSYMAINTGNMVCVPLDYLLPENEIENLLLRSDAEAIIFDGKFLDIFKNIKKKNTTKLKYYINMNHAEHEEDILSFCKLLDEG